MTTAFPGILFICLILDLPSSDCACTCPDGWVIFKNSCYKFLNERHSYSGAEARCKSFGAYLLEINNADENSFVSDFMLLFTNRFLAWFGASDAVKEGTWVWGDNGEKITYSNWAVGQPGSESGNEDCGLLQNYGSGVMWYDARCEDNAFAVCEKPTTNDAVIG